MDDLLHLPPTTSHLVAHALSRDLDRVVLVGVNEEIVTAREMAAAISRFQQVYEGLDPPVSRVAVLAKNRVEVVYATMGLAFAGILTTTLHPMGSVDDYLYVIEDAEIDTLIYDATLYEPAAVALKERASGLKNFLAMGDSDTGRDILALSRDYEPQRLEPRPSGPRDVIRIAYSGGTTGKPKGIMVSNQSSYTSAMLQELTWEWPKDIRHLICAPLSHAGSAVLVSVLLRGGMMKVMPAFDVVEAMRMIEQYKITSVLMVPTMVIAIMDHPRFGEFDLSSLEVVFYGASPFPAARLREAIEKFGKIFFQFYGQAEAPMSITVMRKDEHDVDKPERIAGCGRPTPLVTVALLDDDCSEVPDGQPGEICVRGPLVMEGYLNKPDETEAVFDGGWLHTGDVAVRSDDGFLRIVDRKKDMIISGGFNVFAREVEDVIVSVPGVRQAAVIGMPHEKWGETVMAVVVLEPGRDVSPDAIANAVREKKGAVQAPKRVEFVDALPLSAVGKPDKKALRAQFAA